MNGINRRFPKEAGLDGNIIRAARLEEIAAKQQACPAPAVCGRAA